jgi:hypothetical protein
MPDALSVKILRIFFGCFAVLFLFAACSKKERLRNDLKVYVLHENEKFTLIKNGKPYYIKGAAGHTNLKKLREIGGNTIRTYDTLNLGSILDEASKNQISVMIGLPLPESKHSEFVYNNPEVAAKLIADYTALVNRYKDHPAVLMWCVGNELDFSPNIKYYNFYKTYNKLVSQIHELDPDHPVTTTMVNLRPKNLFCISMFTDVDILSTNVFISLKKMADELDQVSWFWKGPFIISEWGIEGPWLKNKNAWGAYLEDTSTQKARHYESMDTYIPKDNPRYLGAFVFYWGSKQETTHTWFSMFDENGRQTEAVGVMEKIWTGKNTQPAAPQLLSISVDNKIAMDNIIFKPGGQAEAFIEIQNPDSSYFTKWEIYPEDWFLPKNEKNTRRLKPVKGSIITSSLETARFQIPMKEGPYRIFATVYNQAGAFATCNLPFYVVR